MTSYPVSHARDATQFVEIARTLAGRAERRGRIRSDDFLTELMLANSPRLAEDIVRRVLGRLDAEDPSGTMSQTLRCLAADGFNRTSAAAALLAHRNTRRTHRTRCPAAGARSTTAAHRRPKRPTFVTWQVGRVRRRGRHRDGTVERTEWAVTEGHCQRRRGMTMIIESVGADVEAAWKSIAALTSSWGYQTEPVPTAEPANDPDAKGVDPVAVTSLIVSIPSAMLAVADIVDRIRKRRRAGELIERAQQLQAQQAAVRLVREIRSVDLATLTPDQLLDLIADEPSSS
ncbi:hypothetical protein ABT275_33180 [Streptomyces sp. NPDC001185]|uniref:hypothetical protein n=1 Tax=Streptomyces sp. NPDC001185 TaxID=3154380 RepID=UPI00332F1967